MDALTSYRAKVYRHGGDGGAVRRYRESVLLRPEFRFASRHQKVADFGLLRLASSKLNQPICAVSSMSSSSNAEVDLETGETLTEEAVVPSKTAQVRFLLKKECLFGEQFLLVGDDPMFGSWDPSSAVPMIWSEGHVWTIDMDIPIGKKVHFKFILIGSTEDIEWQPDPDRTVEIWETSNAITICEDWEDASFQKIIEAETFIDSFEVLTDIYSASTEDPLPEKNLAIVADNVSDTERISDSEEDYGVVHNREFVISEDVHGEEFFSSEGHVLVPGLSQLSMSLTEEGDTTADVQPTLETIIADPEEAELNDARTQKEAAAVLIDREEQQHTDGGNQLLEGISKEVNSVLNNDFEWGRKMLQSFLANLGLLI